MNIRQLLQKITLRIHQHISESEDTTDYNELFNMLLDGEESTNKKPVEGLKKEIDKEWRNNMFIKELIWKIKEPYVKRKRAYYEQQWCKGNISAKEMCDRVAELYKAKPARKEDEI